METQLDFLEFSSPERRFYSVQNFPEFQKSLEPLPLTFHSLQSSLMKLDTSLKLNLFYSWLANG